MNSVDIGYKHVTSSNVDVTVDDHAMSIPPITLSVDIPGGSVHLYLTPGEALKVSQNLVTAAASDVCIDWQIEQAERNSEKANREAVDQGF